LRDGLLAEKKNGEEKTAGERTHATLRKDEGRCASVIKSTEGVDERAEPM